MSLTRIAVAGYMGAGKSTCIQFLMEENTVLIDADLQAKLLMENNRIIKDAIFMQFGIGVKENDTINFKQLGKKAFSSLTDLKKLNKIIHPPLVDYLRNLVLNQNNGTDVSRIILDAALIPLWRIEDWFDILFWIESSHETRLNRLAKKYYGKIERDELENRMKLQEALFDPPDKHRWIFVRNSAEIADMDKYFGKVKSL